jgi:hypothetical protein
VYKYPEKAAILRNKEIIMVVDRKMLLDSLNTTVIAKYSIHTSYTPCA